MRKGKKAVIFGTASFAEVVHFYLTHDSIYEVVAFTATGDYISAPSFRGLPLVLFEQVKERYPPDEHEMFVAVGYVNLNRTRERFCFEAKAKGYRLLTYVSSKATVWTKAIGENCFILEDNTLQPFVSIGNDVVLWSGNHIGHHSRIDDHCYITSHVVISGHCHIRSHTFIGVNATLRDSITVGRENIIGAGALILRDTGEGEVYAEKGTDIHGKPSSEIKTI
jgi:sugar O-acyltransferase (sialic acid O-acetyltransferase NeuD family)